MTLIAFHAHEDGADIVTDSWSYMPAGSALGRSHKVLALPGMDAAVITQGSVVLGDHWHAVAAAHAHHCGGLDELNDHAETALPNLWRELGPDLPDSLVWHVGYSERAGRFIARGFASEDGFAPFDHEGLFVHPSPLSVRPSDIELRRLTAVADEHGTDLDVQAWAAQPVPPPPTSEAGWFALAKACRQDRAMALPQTGIKVLVGGPLHLTQINRGALMARRADVFDDSSDELAAMMAGSMHPLGQLGVCPCGSGERYVDCHLTAFAGQACLCGSGKVFSDCCSVYADQAVQPAVSKIPA